MAYKKPTAQTQKIKTMPPPVGGINAKDGITLMPETDAVDLVSWIPDTYGIRCRKGYREWAINIPGDAPVLSVLNWIGADTPMPGDTFLDTPTSMPGFLFACTDSGIYDITTTTDAPALAFALSGGDQAGWMSSTIVSNIAGTTLCVASEADGYMKFDGTTWNKPTMGGGAGQIGNIDPGDLCYVMNWKRRLWFVERDSTSAWYLPTDQVTGAATEFDFGSLFKNGGHLSYLASWTIDAGEGIDDYLVAVSSSGDVLVYKGTDPSAAATFGAQGSFFVGQIPVGRRAWSQFGGDLIILSANGIYPLSFVTRGGAQLLQATGQEYSSNIRSPLGADLKSSFTLPGWDLVLHPSERLMLCNVPDYGGYRNRQWVMSTTMNKWTRFEDVPSYSYGQCLSYLFAGTQDGRVLLLFNDALDDIKYGETTGTPIRGVVKGAFSFFEAPALTKQWLQVWPSFLAVDIPSYQIGIAVNFDLSPTLGTPTLPGSANAKWDQAKWDSGAKWVGSIRPFGGWTSVGGVGISGAISLVTSCAGETLLVSLAYMYQVGGP